ncbi:hypothetical protein KGF57_004014 [Candida theae]|uniref:Uncharacterized protein n=1 Tax=Candida theae TaxID=1198502 RepID=A0AAD5BCY3_9ASCO|nr:uncharacterized protein KGF57_004014 [Candida theae]KAI5953022.1 hypothetical protein KGF57_004014 [Candida theae]
MSADSSPFKPSNTPVFIDDSLSPVKLPTRSPMRPPPSGIPHRSSQVGTPSTAKVSITSPLMNAAQQHILRPPFTEKANKTAFLNIESATRRSTLGPVKRSLSSSDRRQTLNLKPPSSLNKPAHTASITSPLHKKRKSANLNKIQQSAQEIELYVNRLNEDRERRLNQSGYRSSMSETEALSSPIKRSAINSRQSMTQLNETSEVKEPTEERRNEVAGGEGENNEVSEEEVEEQEEQDEKVVVLEDGDPNKDNDSIENVEIGRREDIIETAKDFEANIDDSRRRKRNQVSTSRHGPGSSDSDLEILDTNFSRELSQTLTHNHMTRLINESRKDRFSTTTPDRMTEPQPQSPHPHHVKPSTVGDDDQEETVLSPLRHDLEAVSEFYVDDQDNDKLEDEPTMNFLDSPNSRPMFPLTYIEKLQSENQKELLQLNQELRQKEARIDELNKELGKQREVEHKLQHEQELSQIQLRQLEHNVASLTKRNKIFESSNLSFKRKLIDYKITVNEVEEANNVLTDKNKELDNKLSKLQNEHSQMQKDHIEFTMKMDDYETAKLRLLDEKQELVEKLIDLEQEYESKIDLLEDRVKAMEQADDERERENKDLKSKLEASEIKADQLQKEKEKLSIKIDENEGLIKDLDHLVETDKQAYEKEIQELKMKLDREVASLSDELRLVKNSNAEYKEMVNDLTRKLDAKIASFDNLKLQFDQQANELEKAVSEKDHLEYKLALLQNAESDKNRIESELIDLKNKYETDISTKEDEIYNLTTKHNRAQNENHQLKSKLTELETQSATQSQMITAKESDISTYKAEIDKLLNAITTLNQEVATKDSQVAQLRKDVATLKFNHEQDLKTQEDKLVKYLHQEYAQKHMTKMNELKLYYEQERKNLESNIKKLTRDHDFVSKNAETWRQKYNELLREKAERSEV